MPRSVTCFIGALFATGLWLGTVWPASGITNDSAWLTRHWTKEDGLPENRVLGLAQTADGFLWIGTPTGLSRFDGMRVRQFPPADFVSQPNRGILAIVALRKGGLCVAMDRGAVVWLRGESVEVLTGGKELPNFFAHSLAEDNQHAIWISYRNGCLARVKDRAVSSFFLPQGGRAANPVCSVATDKQGRLWCGRGGEISYFSENEFKPRFHFDPGATRLTAGRDGGVWVSVGFRLYKIGADEQVKDLGKFDPERNGAEPSAILEDEKGDVWIGTTYGGLFRFGSDGFEKVPTTHPGILSLAEDMEGNLWVGTDGGGLNQVRERALALETTDTGLPFEVVQSLTQASNGDVWAATENGALARRNEKGWTTIYPEGAWRGDATCVEAGPSGEVWVGTRSHGVLSWRNNALDALPGIQTRGQRVHTLLVSKNKDLWIGEDLPASVQRFRQGKLETLELPRQLTVIRACAEDAAGRIWFGTSRGVLLRAEGDRLVDETALIKGNALSIRCLYATEDGSLWIGSPGWGLGRLKDKQFSTITSGQGLHDDYISQIIDDGRGWMWFGSGGGIFKARQQELNAAAEKRANHVRSIYYGRGEGLPALQATFGDSPGVLRTRDGRVWLPMRTGLAVVDPAKLADNLQPPKVLITRAASGDHTLAFYGGAVPVALVSGPSAVDLRKGDTTIKVPASHRRLDLEFTALSFTGAENVQFRYRLEGLDDEWVDAGAQRSAMYSGLTPGDYKFRVTACNTEGMWNPNGAVVAFTVLPFFWQTWAFRIGVVAMFTGGVIALVRYVSFRRLRARLSQLELQSSLHQERARIARDIHDDLGANLTQIALLGELAQQDRSAPDRAGEHISKISITARHLIKSLDEIVWAVNPSNDTLSHLVDYTGQFALDYLRVAGVRCRLDLPDEVPAREVSSDVRHNIFLIVKEGLHNIIKHAQGTEAWLRVHVAASGLLVVIEDNGCGFEQPSLHSGADGLRNMRRRAEEIGAQLRIQSEPRRGTRISVEMPWTRPKMPRAAASSPASMGIEKKDEPAETEVHSA